MSEYFPVSGQAQPQTYYQSPDYFRALDTPLSMEEVERLRRLHEPVRYSEDGRRRLSIEKLDSDLYKRIDESSLHGNEDELQKFRAMSVEYALRTAHLNNDKAGEDMRQAILDELMAELPVCGEQAIVGLRRYEYPGSPTSLTLDGMQIEDLAEVYKEITPRVIRPSEYEWQHAVVDVAPIHEAPIEQYDLTPFEVVDVVSLADEESETEGGADMIGYESFHHAKLLTLRIGARALAAVTGQFERIEHLLTKTAA